jgi:polysaccharide biosynthesis protein PslG
VLHLRPPFVAAAPIRGRFAATLAVAFCLLTSPAAAGVEHSSQNSRFGFAAGGNLHNLAPAELDRYLDGVRTAHAGWLRIDVNWNVIQYSGRDTYNWEPFDSIVRGVTSRGVHVLAGILYTPPWARAAGTPSTSPPTDLAEYARFVKTVVRRYAPMGVHAYEIWNEPNVPIFWSPRPDPARYAQLLKLAYAAVKSIDRSARVLSGGLSPHGAYGQIDESGMNPLTFLERMYAAGAARSFDALAWHPFNFPYGFGFAKWSAWSQMTRTSPSARSILRAHGDGAKKIWATEFGFPTGRTPRDVTEAKQAQLLRKSLNDLVRRPWAGPAFVYSYRDSGTNERNVEQNFGVVRYDYSPKPAYRVFQSAAAATG